MKKKLILLICITFLLIGCGKTSPEEKLCKSIRPQIDKFDQKEITYEEFLNTIEADYNNYCSEEKNNICTSISLMYSFKNINLDLEDCNKYNEDTDLGKSMKDLCETSNRSKITIASQKEQSQNNNIFLLKRDCDNLK